jgi:hypothetical protein
MVDTYLSYMQVKKNGKKKHFGTAQAQWQLKNGLNYSRELISNNYFFKFTFLSIGSLE